MRLTKLTLAAGAALALLSLSVPASAAQPDRCQARKGDACRFYVFDPSAFEGNRKGPGSLFIESARSAEFEALHHIKPRSFLRSLLETSRMAVFR